MFSTCRAMKTLDFNHLYWTDHYGNTYFACEVTVDFNQPTESSFVIPFTYGFDKHYQAIVKKELVKRGFIPEGTDYVYIDRYCRENGIAYYEMSRKALKRELTAIK